MEDYAQSYKSGLSIDMNWDTLEKSKKEKHPFYIYKDNGDLGEDNIALSIEEAEWLIVKLKEFIDLTSE